MAHPILFWLTLAFLGLVFLGWFLHRNHLVLDRYEYLEVLSLTEWRGGREVLEMLEKKHDGWLSYVQMYSNLSDLEEEGLVEHRDSYEMFDGMRLLKREFRRKPGGRPRKDTTESPTQPLSTLQPA